MAHVPEDWPHRAASRFVEAGGLRWHVQRQGTGPTLLLIHGTAASTHSFRAIAARLADAFDIIMVDLPGHGFSGALADPGLPRVARGLGALLAALDARPLLIAGHSAGAAIAIRMVLDGLVDPEAVIGLAPALQPFGGAANGLAARLTRLAFLNPIAPRVLSLKASPERVRRIIARTGSHLDDEGVDFYVRLLRRPEHVAGALRLMAHWDLHPLLKDLPMLTTPVLFVVGENDEATPARDAERTARQLRDARMIRLPGQGHLAHEEDPDTTVDILRRLKTGDMTEFQRSA